MPDETELLFDSRQVAESLGVGSAMLRRYAVMLEELSGEQLPLHRRLGREFTRGQVEVLKVTRDLVQRRGLSVEVAMREALGLTERLPELERVSVGTLSPEQLTEALTEAYTRANEPLLQELRELRLELSKRDVRETSASLEDKKHAEVLEKTKHGVLVRAALWLESRLWGR